MPAFLVLASTDDNCRRELAYWNLKAAPSVTFFQSKPPWAQIYSLASGDEHSAETHTQYRLDLGIDLQATRPQGAVYRSERIGAGLSRARLLFHKVVWLEGDAELRVEVKVFSNTVWIYSSHLSYCFL